MTEKFFHDLLHYPGEDPATHLSQHLKYLDLRSDYDFFHVLILETEPDPAKSELDFPIPDPASEYSGSGKRKNGDF